MRPIAVLGDYLIAHVPEGRWWRRGKRHVVTHVQFRRNNHGISYAYVVTCRCGATIEAPTLETRDPSVTPSDGCKRCFG